MSRIAVIGAGAWGTSLALSLSTNQQHYIRLWSHSEKVAECIAKTGQNTHFLPGFFLPESLCVTTDLAHALDDAEIVLSVMPSRYVRPVYQQMAPLLHKDQFIVSATKGIEEHTFLRISEVIKQGLADTQVAAPVAVLSGPSFAQEVADGSPTALTLAVEDARVAAHLQHEFSNRSLRIYTNDDVTGVEIGGSLKNVIAIAVGMCVGLKLGSNSTAALITRGLAEITRLAVACGGQAETLAGLAGMGDLVLTATGSLSRNRSVGFDLGCGKPMAEIVEGLRGKVAEGIQTTSAALGLAQRHGVELPITQQVAAILYGGRAPRDAMRELMSRPGRDE